MIISEQNQERIKRKVESGQYGSPDEVIARALELLDESDEALARELAEVRAKIQEGIEQLKKGDYTEYTDETLDELFEDVMLRGRERRALGTVPFRIDARLSRLRPRQGRP